MLVVFSDEERTTTWLNIIRY